MYQEPSTDSVSGRREVTLLPSSWSKTHLPIMLEEHEGTTGKVLYPEPRDWVSPLKELVFKCCTVW